MKVLLTISLALLLGFAGIAGAMCPSPDITGDCKVDLEDFAIMASEWLTEGLPDPEGMVWVSINDPGVSGHEGFDGEMSKYETTNAQYCEFLNAALASNDIIVNIDIVKGASGPYSGQNYYNLSGSGYYRDGAPNGGAARINWPGSSFTVDIGFENHPVTHVSWYGAMAFCEYFGYRLPTEWEWQAVADYNGTYTHGHGAGALNNSLANYKYSTHPYGTTTVGSYGTIHGYGMCDMAGNVWEWTTSTYSGDYRVAHGGSWIHNGRGCTVGSFTAIRPRSGSYNHGFRVCR